VTAAAPSILAVICARGGSKGLPGKNIKPLCGKPLIGWTIDQARESALFADIACSSDDDAILAAARDHGATILIKRPDDLASDTAGTLPALTHAIQAATQETGRSYEYVVLLQPTSPLRLPADIREAVDMAMRTGAPSVVSATPSRQSPYYTVYEPRPDGQDAPPTYDLNGSIYVWRTQTFLETERTIFPDTQLYIMPPERSIDIDTIHDFVTAQAYIEQGLWLQNPKETL
jgi:CMP-N,N'-diacetyllegionaminic acid synthase